MLLQGIVKDEALGEQLHFQQFATELHWDQWIVSWCLEE
jgi:hypothetical protein